LSTFRNDQLAPIIIIIIIIIITILWFCPLFILPVNKVPARI
jgi:hypothetical protein